jgi:hypothetical protein
MNKVYINHRMFAGKRVAFAVVDQMNIKRRHEKLYKKMYDVTWFFTKRLAGMLKSDAYYANTVDEALALADNYDIVILQSVGNMINDNQFLEYVDEYVAQNPDFFYVGFTLDWQDNRWVELHHQMIVINANKWRELSRCQYGGWATAIEPLPHYSRSVENFHDHYTPYWIKGEPGATMGQRKQQGWGMIKCALENGIKIDNFTQQMRNCRLFLYPESEPEKFYESIINETITDPTMNPNQKRWLKTFSIPPQIWIFNSEAYYFPLSTTKNIETYLGPAAGFKYLDLLKHNETVKFVLYDYNERSVEWLKMLRDEWDGHDLSKYLQSKTDYIKYYKYINGNIETNIDILYEEFGGEEQFLELWTRFRQSEVEFVVTNLYDRSSIESLRGRCDGRTLFYYSNIFATDLMVKIMSLEEIEQAHTQAIDIFKQRGNVITYGTDFLSEWIVGNYEKETENV